jgi:hypothetical protein
MVSGNAVCGWSIQQTLQGEQACLVVQVGDALEELALEGFEVHGATLTTKLPTKERTAT